MSTASGNKSIWDNIPDCSNRYEGGNTQPHIPCFPYNLRPDTNILGALRPEDMSSLNWTNLVPQHFVNPGNGQDQLPAGSLPATARGYVEPHYLLLARPSPLIEYNVALAPHTALANTFHANWPFEPATAPPVATMTITAPGLIPRPIVVHPSERNPAMVTISDILSAIHSALCRRVDPEEYPYIAQHTAEGVLRPGWVERGITRLEVLNGRVRWAGLSEGADELGNRQWKLVLENF